MPKNTDMVFFTMD